MKRKAFTLIELLVVISIIAVLLSILMPSLSKVKERGRRAVCMSNIKGLMEGVYAYSMNYNGNIPDSFPGMNASQGFIAWHQYVRDDPDNYRASAETGFVNLGRLYDAGFIDTEDAFYCPAQKQPRLKKDRYWPLFQNEYPRDLNSNNTHDTSESYIFTTYMYGLMGQVGPRLNPPYPDLVMDSLKISRLSNQAMICDVFVPMNFDATLEDDEKVLAHKDNAGPVAFGDGSVRMVTVGPKVAEATLSQSYVDIHRADVFVACYFKYLAGSNKYLINRCGLPADIEPAR